MKTRITQMDSQILSLYAKGMTTRDIVATFPRSTVVRWNAKQVYIELKQEYEWQNSKKHKLNPIKIKHIKRRI